MTPLDQALLRASVATASLQAAAALMRKFPTPANSTAVDVARREAVAKLAECIGECFQLSDAVQKCRPDTLKGGSEAA